VKFEGKVWRHIPRGKHALHVGWILRADGRWNRSGVYGCLYTARTKEGALAELRKLLARLGEYPKPRDLVSIRVVIDPVVDLTDPTSSPVSPDAEFLTGDSDQDIEACRELADRMRALGYAGILAPSAAAEGEENLMVYIDGPASALELDEGGDRIPMYFDQL
jgi:RES domain-containing protein